MAFIDLPDGEHTVNGKTFTKSGDNTFTLDGKTLNAKEIEKATRTTSEKMRKTVEETMADAKVDYTPETNTKPADKPTLSDRMRGRGKKDTAVPSAEKSAPEKTDESGNTVLFSLTGDLETLSPQEEADLQNNEDFASEVVNGIKFSMVTDMETLDRLNAEEEAGDYLTLYRSVQIGPDGKLHSPMAAKVAGKWGPEIELGVWEQSDEHPELAKAKIAKDGKIKYLFDLNKGNGKTIGGVLYNPYIHSSNTMLNDQFSEAYQRPELVTIEVHVPKSELTSGYKAQRANDAVGMKDWKAGVVQGKLTGKRKVMLSRWDKPVRIVPDSEVAQHIKELIGNKDIAIPANVVTPALRAELEKIGVKIDYSVKLYDPKQEKTERPEIKFSKAGDLQQNIEEINQKFNDDLDRQIAGTLPKGYIHQLGTPGDILLSTGVPNLPIELSARQLKEKADTAHHPFDINDVRDLPKMLQKPIGVFSYGDKNKAQNIIVEVQKDGKNFIVGLSLNFQHDGLVVNSIRGLYPKDLHEWLTWIQDGKSLYLNKEKIQKLIDQQRRNLADVEYLNLDSVNNIIQNFENPSVSQKNPEKSSGGVKFSKVGDLQTEQEKRYYQVPWEEGLQKAVNDKNVREPVFVSKTPEVFRKIGFTSLPMLMNVRHLRLNYYNKTDFEKMFGTMRQGEHAHDLRDKLNGLPTALEHPLAIVVNQTPNATPGSVVAITDMNVNGKKVVVPVLIESISKVENGRVDSHLVLTVYDSNNWMEQFLTPAIKAEKKGIGIFYFDEEKANRYGAYSNKIGSIPTGFVHNIAEAGIKVKPQTETFQFKKWFKNSKAVDENGEPQVFSHFTGDLNDFYSFENGHQNGIYHPRKGFYFVETNEANEAELNEYFGDREIKAWLSVQKPLDLRNDNIWKEVQRISENTDEKNLHDFIANGSAQTDRFIDAVIKQGYDGIILPDAMAGGTEFTSWIVFDSTQIKSATDNIGTFDGTNPDIRFSLINDLGDTSLSPINYRRRRETIHVV